MTLREAIKKNEGNTIRIGAASGFIYIARCSWRTVNVIERLSEKEYRRIKKALEDNKKHKSNYATYWDVEARRRIKSEISTCKYDNIQLYVNKEMRKIEHAKRRDKETTEKNITRLQKKYDNFIPFLDREVKAEYKSDINNDIIILFEGDENGDYWDANEYKQKYKRGIKGDINE